MYFTLSDCVFWDLPGDVLAAPASALRGWMGVILSFSLSLSHALHVSTPCVSSLRRTRSCRVAKSCCSRLVLLAL